MKQENKIFGYIIVGIVTFFLILVVTVNSIINTVSIEVDKKIEKIKLEAQETIEGIKCEFNYKNIHYNGICTQELLDYVVELISYDRGVELLQLCMQNPYAYRYELCKDMEAIK